MFYKMTIQMEKNKLVSEKILAKKEETRNVSMYWNALDPKL